MSMHTPGPWTVQEAHQGTFMRVFSQHEHVANAFDCVAGQAQSNAALIAAAPDLLACCEEMERAIEMSQEEHGYGDRLRSAIAKARGQ